MEGGRRYGEQKCHKIRKKQSNELGYTRKKKKINGIDLFDRMSGMSGHGLRRHEDRCVTNIDK